MAAIVHAHVDITGGWVECRFPRDLETITKIKIPGSRWNPDQRCWFVPLNAWAVLRSRLRVEETFEPVRVAQLPPVAARLKPYQVDAAKFLINRKNALLSFEQRVGKTPTALIAAEALIQAGCATDLLICYPATVKENWRKQILDWTGRTLIATESEEGLDQADLDWCLAQSPLVLGCHWEILRHQVGSLLKLYAQRPFILIADEIQNCKNRKGGRYKALRLLSEAPSCIAIWGLSGTPQRNYPRDLWGIFDAIQPGSMGGYWTYAGAKGTGYCAAYEGPYGWIDKGESNPEELSARLAAFSYRVTRAQVAAHLPKAQRSVILCSLSSELAKRYKQLEKVLAPQIKGALSDADPTANEREALKQLAMCTSEGKIPTAIDRALSHAEGRRVKVIVFAHHHEVLRSLEAAFLVRYQADADATDVDHLLGCAYAGAGVAGAAGTGCDPGGWCLCQGHPPVFLAGGWLTPAKRHVVIEEFKNCRSPAILLANTLSTSVGIDLSDADTAIFLELEWVPSDFAQAHDRIQDVHLGKRTTPPLYEYLLVKQTVDTDMAGALLSKLRSITKIVGADTGSGDMAQSLRDSGVAGGNVVLASTDKETVRAAIHALRARLLGQVDTDPVDEKASIAASFGDGWDDDDGEIAVEEA